jgi:hypothetical protein
VSRRPRLDAMGRLFRGVACIVLAGLVAGCRPSVPCGTDQGCHAVADLREGVVLSGVYQILDRDGEPLASVGGEARRWVHLEALPPAVPAAWIAVEDRRFRDHGGVDLRGLFRAALANLDEGGVAEGASTIPMQLVRALWPEEVWSLGRWKRKYLELRMAPHLVSELGRDRVLELYLNAIYLGDGQYGVGAAARYYFGVSPGDLTLAQIATLVGMTKTPEAFNPREHPERARTRRDLVLGILAREGVAGPEEVDAALAAELELVNDDPASRERSYVTAAVLRELRLVAPELVDQGGLNLHTTIDPRAQEATLIAMREHLERIQNGEHGSFLGGDQPVEGAAIALESTTGAILAVVGGRDFASTPLNRALQSRRPVGSLVKPLIFAAALERGIRATRPLATAALAIETEDGVWSPRDHVVVPYVLPHDMVVHSSNRAAVRLGQEVGARTFAVFARELGINGHIPSYPSTFLGAFDASLAEMTAAFAAFENGGRVVEPHFIRRIVNTEGITVWSRRGEVPTRRLLHGADGRSRARRHARRGRRGNGGRRAPTPPGARRREDRHLRGGGGRLVRGRSTRHRRRSLDRAGSAGPDGRGRGRRAARRTALGALDGRVGPTRLRRRRRGRHSERLQRVSLGQRAEGDSVAYCRGGEGPSRLVPEWVLRELRVCEPSPLEWLRVGAEDSTTWQPLPVQLDTVRSATPRSQAVPEKGRSRLERQPPPVRAPGPWARTGEALGVARSGDNAAPGVARPERHGRRDACRRGSPAEGAPPTPLSCRLVYSVSPCMRRLHRRWAGRHPTHGLLLAQYMGSTAHTDAKPGGSHGRSLPPRGRPIRRGGARIRRPRSRSKKPRRWSRKEIREVKAQGKDAARQMKATAEKEIDKRSTQVADGLDSVVRAMYAAADELDGDGQDRLAEYTRRAADQVHRVTDYLHDEDTPAMLTDLEDMARTNPGTFLGTSFAAGLASGALPPLITARTTSGEGGLATPNDTGRTWPNTPPRPTSSDVDRGPTIGGVHHQSGMSHQPPGGTTWDGSATTTPEHERRR